MPDVKEQDLPKIASYSDIKEVRLVKTDGTSTGMAIDTFINQIAEKVARVEGFASVVAELLGITNFALMAEEQWTSGNLNDAPNGATAILCWNNSAAFSNLPVINDNNNATLFTFKYHNSYASTGGIQFLLHGSHTDRCYIRWISNGIWASWKEL